MTIERKTSIDQLEIQRDGALGVRLALLICEGEQELAKKFHRVLLPAGADVDAELSHVANHLTAMGEAPLTEAAVSDIRDYFALIALKAQAKE